MIHNIVRTDINTRLSSVKENSRAAAKSIGSNAHCLECSNRMRSRLCQVVNTFSPRAPRQLVTRSILPSLSVRVNSHLPSPRHLRTNSHFWKDFDLTEPRNSGLGHRTDDSTRNNTRLAVLSDEEFTILARLLLSEVQDLPTWRKLSVKSARINALTR